MPNPEWRPFDLAANQATHSSFLTDNPPKACPTATCSAGQPLNKADYRFSPKALKALFAILGSFYQFCLQEDVITANPVALIRQKSKFLRQEATTPVIRRLSNAQWRLVMHLAKARAKADPQHGRTVFILSCLYGMYLRISELTATARWIPTMGDFFKDHQGNWWFNTVGKGNKARQIAVSADMLAALKHYRTAYLNLPPCPARNESTPLIGHISNPDKPMTDARTLRRLVQACFDVAADQLRPHDPEGAQNLSLATVHWLRHTGISEDVKHRPREHVRDDAGHSSSAITDRYVDVELAARATSAKLKRLLAEES